MPFIINQIIYKILFKQKKGHEQLIIHIITIRRVFFFLVTKNPLLEGLYEFFTATKIQHATICNYLNQYLGDMHIVIKTDMFFHLCARHYVFIHLTMQLLNSMPILNLLRLSNVSLNKQRKFGEIYFVVILNVKQTTHQIHLNLIDSEFILIK